MMGDFENFNLIKSQEEFESNKPHVTSILNGISKQIDAQTDKWYKAQNCKAVYDLNIDYVEHK